VAGRPPGVEPLVLARGVTAMTLKPVGELRAAWGAGREYGGLQRMRLRLAWAADSPGGADEATVVVDAVIFGE